MVPIFIEDNPGVSIYLTDNIYVEDPVIDVKKTKVDGIVSNLINLFYFNQLKQDPPRHFEEESRNPMEILSYGSNIEDYQFKEELKQIPDILLTLRPYQLSAIQWMKERENRKFNTLEGDHIGIHPLWTPITTKYNSIFVYDSLFF